MRSKSLLWSFNYAVEGIVYALRTQRNMRLHFLAAVLVLIVAAVLDVGRYGIIAIVFAIGIVLVTELVNTAIEATVDLAIDGYQPMAKVAKDVAAGAVLVSASVALVIGWLVLFEPLRRVVERGLQWVSVGTVDLTVIASGIVLLCVVAVKAYTMKFEGGTFAHGGWPSGHTALAFGLAAAIGYVTGSAGVFVIALFIAALVAQSRVEGDIHTIPQVIVGGALGFVIVTLLFQLFGR